MKPSEVRKLISLDGKCSYNDVNKAEFRRLSLKLLRAACNLMGLPAGSFSIRYNAAGVACSGDATLHAEDVYVSFNADGVCSHLGVLVRSCEGRKDYVGGRNCWYPFAKLAEEGPEGLAQFADAVRRAG
jgi:hypothetical protein